MGIVVYSLLWVMLVVPTSLLEAWPWDSGCLLEGARMLHYPRLPGTLLVGSSRGLGP